LPPTFAQKDTTTKTKFSYGISIGIVQPIIKYKTTDWTANGLADTLKSVESNNSTNQGSSLGIIGIIHINKHFALRFQPEFTLTHDVDFVVNKKDGKFFRVSREFMNFEMPMHLIYNFPESKCTPSVFLGARYILDALKNIRRRYPYKFQFQPESHGFDMGVGFNIKYKKLIIRPEMFYCYGATNILEVESIYSNKAIFKEIKRDYVSIKLNLCSLN
jgi:hypothetical protein